MKDERPLTSSTSGQLQIPWLRPVSQISVKTSQPSIEGPIKRIIVADDEEDWREFVSEVLKNEYEIYIVRDGEECIALLGWMLDEKKPPAMIITDWKMPKMDGIELIRKAREIDTGLKFILITANTRIEMNELVLEIRPDSFFEKPLNPIEIRAAVKNLLSSKSKVNDNCKKPDCKDDD